MDIRGGDPTPAYMLGNALITRGDPRVAVFGDDRRAMTEAVKRAFDTTLTTCSHQTQLDDMLRED